MQRWRSGSRRGTPGRPQGLDRLSYLTVLAITDEARELAGVLNAEGAVPRFEPRDALHIAVAAIQRVPYLVTWNFRHIANVTMRSKIEQVCRDAGFEPPVICSPPEIPGDNDD